MDPGVSEFGSLTMVQRTLTKLWGRIITLKTSPPSSVVCRPRGRRRASYTGHGVVGICDERPSPVLSLSSSASVLRLDFQLIGSPANVECEFHDWSTSSSDRTTGRCGPEQHRVAGTRVSESRGRPWTPCCQPRSRMCPLQTSASTELVFHLLRRRGHLQLLGQHTRPLDRQA